MANRLKNAAPRRALAPAPTGIRRFLTPRVGIVAAALVGVSATAAIIPSLTLTAEAAHSGAPGTELVAEAGTLDAFAARENSVSRDQARPELDPAEAAEARAETMAATDEQITASAQEAALASRDSSLDKDGQAIKSEAKRIRAVEARKFYWPTAGGVSSWWGPRFHPILHYTRMHSGLDIGGACNQPIWAAQDGVISSTSSGGASGNMIRIDHGVRDGKRIETAYLHMNSFAVSEGQKVSRGQVIGKVGSTGLSTACHLHFVTYADGTNVDPVPFLKPGETSAANKRR